MVGSAHSTQTTSMNHTLTIAKRELTSFFFSPIAYVVLGLFGAGTFLFFCFSFEPGQNASLRQTFGAMFWLMIFLVPGISMRTISEEFRAGTIETLMTSPISDAQVVIGKWLGAMGFLVALLSPVLVATILLSIFGKPDYGPIATGLVGLLFVGGLYLAIGLLASAVTQHQLIAFLVTIFVILSLTVGMYMIQQVQWVGAQIKQAAFQINVNMQFEVFTKGIVDLGNIIYFVAGTVFFLFVTTKVLESRRWR